jgi:hypothetical protein
MVFKLTAGNSSRLDDGEIEAPRLGRNWNSLLRRSSSVGKEDLGFIMAFAQTARVLAKDGPLSALLAVPPPVKTGFLAQAGF